MKSSRRDKLNGVNRSLKSSTGRMLTLSYLSLFLAFVVLTTSTVAWFTFRDTAIINSEEFSLEASTGLRVNEGEDITNHIKLNNVYLYEASSVDGRNMFFPTTGTFTSNTLDMVFREGNVGDKNQTYVCKDFTLYGDSSLTEIYVKSYSITVGDQVFNGGTEIKYNGSIPVEQVKKDECPVRIAFITDSSKKPIVIDPTAIVDAHVKNYNAVDDISENGYAVLEQSDAASFSNHYFSYNQPIFKLFGTQPQEVTMVVWLEGTGGNCDKYVGKEISIDIELESNYSDTEIIYFVDDTLPDTDNATEDGYTWINGNGDCIVTMAYKDPSDNYALKTVVMNPVSDTKWYAPLPKDVTTDIYFYRYSLTDEVIYNAWYTKANVNNETSGTVKNWLRDSSFNSFGNTLQTTRGTSVTYTARRGNGYSITTVESERLSPCIGFWDYTSTGGSGGNTGGGETNNTGLINIGFAVNIPDDKGWIIDNLKDGWNMYAVYSDNGVENELSLDTDKNDYKRCECKNKFITSGSILKRFELRDKDGKNNKYLYLANGELKLDASNNYTFKVNKDDKIEL